MNRFVIFLLIICTILCTIHIPDVQYYAQDREGTYYFYTAQNYDNALCNKVQNGNGYIISCDIKHAEIVRQQLNTKLLHGESFCFVGKSEDITSILNKLNVIYKSQNDLDIVAYSPQVPYALTIDNKVYNIQISQNQNNICVGFPAILGSF